jgi:signal transduction histidine kinase
MVLLVALYTVAAYRPLLPSVGCLVATFVAQTFAIRYELFSSITSWERAVLAFTALFVLFDSAAWGVGRWVAASRAQARHLVETRALLAAEAVNAERLRIARELHDIVAHAVTVMVVQATGASRLMDREPDVAREAMQAVQDAGRLAMAEMRRLLEVLRTVTDDDEQSVGSEMARMSMLNLLMDQVRAAGVSVEVTTLGTEGQLDPSVDLTGYRVVQEALTNITRHAGPGTSADVRYQWSPDRLEIVITDDGKGSPQPGVQAMSSGYGFIGLRERVKLIGGEVHAGPDSIAGYRVHAILPAEPA